MNMIFAFLHMGLGLLLAFTPFALWPVCAKAAADGGHMNCWYMGVLVAVLGVLVCASALCSVLMHSTWINLIVKILSLVVVAALNFVPSGVIRIAGDGWTAGLCAMETMQCRAVMMPHAMWISVGLCLASAFWAICGLVTGKR